MSSNLDQTLDEAATLIESDQIDAAIEVLMNLLRVYHDHPPALMLLGSAYLASGHLLNAEKVFARLVSIEPGNGQYSMALFNTLLREEMGDKAVEEINRFLSVADRTQQKAVVDKYISIIERLASGQS